MCFAPAGEAAFFNALRDGVFDAKAVCNTVDAMQATASIEEDKIMITDRIAREVGLNSYNEQLRQFLEHQYRLVAIKARGRPRFRMRPLLMSQSRYITPTSMTTRDARFPAFSCARTRPFMSVPLTAT